MRSASRLSIAFNVAISPGVSGGIEQSTVGLIDALGKLDGPERYKLVLRNTQQADWLQSYLGPNQEFAVRPQSAASHGSALKRALLPTVRRVRSLLTASRNWPEIPVSDGFIESLDCDVVHFPTQAFTFCALPSIYNPHDLQHLHYPQFFSRDELIWRETIYQAGCRYSQTVAVGSQWIKDDVIKRYGTHPNKVQVIPWAPPTQFYREPRSEDLTRVPAKYQLHTPFALYPAQTWPHKNHLRLFEALAYLRDSRGIAIPLVCTGSPYKPFWPKVEAHLFELNLQEQVKFLGFVPEEDLRTLYRLAQFMVLPTLYEADSCPIHEAWSEGLPVASSNATALPDQVHDAGLLFDPLDVRAIADAMARMSRDERLRKDLRLRGYRRVKDFDWERTAKAYRAVYRRAAEVSLGEEDRWLLGWDWMREPDKAMELTS